MKRVLAGACSLVALAAFTLAPVPDGLSATGMRAIGVLLFVFCLWIGDTVPKSIATVLGMLLLPLLGIEDSMGVVFSNFMSPILFFLLAAFGFAAMVKSTTLPQRVMGFMLKRFGSNTSLIVLAFMVSAAAISTVMSDLAACALLSAMAMAALSDRAGEREEGKAFYRCVLIGIPIGSLAGGIATPIGSSSNITIIQLLSNTTGIEVSFPQWMSLGVPVAIVSILISWVALIAAQRPGKLDGDTLERLLEEFSGYGAFSVAEIKVMVLFALLFVGWCFGSAIGLESTVVALIGLVILFLPGIDLLTFSEYQNEVPLDLVIMLGGLMSLSSSLLSTGAVDWMVDSIVDGIGLDTPFAVLLACSAIVMIIRTFLPSGPPVAVMLTPAFVAAAVSVGLPPICIIIAISTWCQITFLVPAIDALYLITYSKGYYSIFDVAKFGLPLTIVLLPLLAGALMGLSAMLGY